MNVQGRGSCFDKACLFGQLDVAKYLYGLGGDKLLMLQSKVRACVIVTGVYTQVFSNHINCAAINNQR